MSTPTAGSASSRARLLRWGLPALGVLIVAVVLLVWVLPGDDGQPAGSASATSSAADQTTEPESPPTPTEPPAVITQAPAPALVAREGVTDAERTIAGATVSFADTASWADGASIRVSDAHQQVTRGTGPGELSGQPQTVFTLELTNGSDRPLDVNAVVVQATFGAARAQATPLYDGESIDFGGTIAPGETAVAVYSFAIPDTEVGDVTLTVDVDGFRYPVVFTGAVPAD